MTTDKLKFNHNTDSFFEALPIEDRRSSELIAITMAYCFKFDKQSKFMEAILNDNSLSVLEKMIYVDLRHEISKMGEEFSKFMEKRRGY